MKNLVGVCLFGLSGGPTSVINATALGIIKESMKQNFITDVYACCCGVDGILNEDFFDISKEDPKELEKLMYTPAAIFGSVRHKLKDYHEDNTEYKRILEVFIKYNIRYFFYIGGNDSMDTCNKISKFFNDNDYECRIIGVPKTIDNDLAETDHSPGFASAAKYVATSVCEVKRDLMVYHKKNVVIFEIMGRNTGWLTASACLASLTGYGPDLVYVPEKSISIERFCDDVQRQLENKDIVVIAVSEGIKEENGHYLVENHNQDMIDHFGHVQLGGVGDILARAINSSIDAKVRVIEFSLLQRCASHCSSFVDAKEAYDVGRFAVLKAIEGHNDKMVIITRQANEPYQSSYALTEIGLLANFEKKLPLSWIKEDNTGMTDEFIRYALPLISGENHVDYYNGLPDYAKLRLIKVQKRL